MSQELLEKYFRIKGTVEPSGHGLIVKGDLDYKPSTCNTLKRLPVKIYQVTGKLLLESEQLETIDNFPNTVGNMQLYAPKLKSLVSSTGDISCSNLSLHESKIEDVKSSSFKDIVKLEVADFPNLKTLDGIDPSTIQEITIKNCPNFQGKFNNFLALVKGSVSGNISVSFPIVSALLKNIKFTTTNPELSKIVSKYGGNFKPEHTINLMRELRAAGFKDAARV